MDRHIRWNDKRRLTPTGQLQSAYPLRRRHTPTELNPAGIYAPPGDPLHRPMVKAPVENLFLKRIVIVAVLWLGAWGILGFALVSLMGAL